MSALRDRLIARIERTGPITVADYMAECLLHPQHGYYATRDPLGAEGDFTTAPEISQMFGELLGLAIAQCWLDQGRPDPFILAEPGPGRGTLIMDALRATKRVPGFHDAMRLHLIEASSTLKSAQTDALRAFEVTWHDSLATLPEGPLFLLANEFLDALPIRQFIRQGDGWRERQIGVEGGDLVFGASGPVSPDALSGRLGDTEEGQMVELCAAATALTEDMARRIAAHGGVAILIDYGESRSLGDTLQAVRNHAPDPVLAHPGDADLTAHVDFGAVRDSALAVDGISASGPVPQGMFLERLGITERARALARSLSGPALESHISAHRRLTHPSEMGTLFKVISIYPESAPTPPGFET